jgi:hypothetical protein
VHIFTENKETTTDNKNFITYQQLLTEWNKKRKALKLSISQPALTGHETCLGGTRRML